MGLIYLRLLLASSFYTASILGFPTEEKASLQRINRCGLDNCTTSNPIRNDTDHGTQAYKPQADDSYQKLLERLRWYLGAAGLANFTRKEADFSDLDHLNVVRRISKNAKIPKELLDAVEPQAVERLMELMVRIAENPNEWQAIHRALGFLYESEEPGTRKKRSVAGPKKHRRKRQRRHHIVYSMRSAGHKTRRKMRKKLKSIKHRSKHYYGRYRINVTEPFKMRFRHHSTPPRYGVYNPASLTGLLEKPFPQKETDEDKHFERWKVKSGWAELRNGSKNYHSKMNELRRWGLLKQHGGGWLKTNGVEETNSKRPKINADSEARLKEKATLLATNRWPSVTPEERLPKFSFHRVTASSPNFLPRSQKRQRSAYVAVSLIPNNITVPFEANKSPKISPESTASSVAWPDLFDQLFLTNYGHAILNSTGSNHR